MSRISGLLTMIVTVVLVWLICAFIPMSREKKLVFISMVGVAVGVWLLFALGIISYTGNQGLS
jgi:uncharacterized membrane protein